MDAAALLAAAQRHFSAEHASQTSEGLALLTRNGPPVALALLVQQPDASAYLRAFEDGMQALLATRQQQPGWELALVLEMQPAQGRQAASYRPALKKYSNSVVFEDVGIGLLLLGGLSPAWSPPAEVNTFLRGLDRWLVSTL